MAVEFIGDGGSDGTTLGQTTSDKISFHGATPIAQATPSITATTTAATLANLRSDVTAIIGALRNLGLVK